MSHLSWYNCHTSHSSHAGEFGLSLFWYVIKPYWTFHLILTELIIHSDCAVPPSVTLCPLAPPYCSTLQESHDTFHTLCCHHCFFKSILFSFTNQNSSFSASFPAAFTCFVPVPCFPLSTTLQHSVVSLDTVARS